MSIEVSVRHAVGDFKLDVSASIPLKGVTCLVGKSGSGKSTLLRCLAGLEKRSTGRIVYDGQVWLDTENEVFVRPERRQVGYAFQQAALFPHLSVKGNLSYGLKRSSGSRQTLEHIASLCGILDLLDRSTEALSGGEQQRVSLARALLRDPVLLLLDEPFASLDKEGKDSMIACLKGLLSEIEIPVVYVTHSMAEVVRLATQVLILEEGRISKAGPLGELIVELPGAREGEDQLVSYLDALSVEYDSEYALSAVHTSAGTLQVAQRLDFESFPLRLVVAARDVSLSLAPPEQSSVLNVLPSRIVSIDSYDEARLCVRLQLGRDTLFAFVTRKSCDALGLDIDKPVFALIKAVSVFG